METTHEIGSPTGNLIRQQNPLQKHKLKLKSPTYDGNYATFEEWKYQFAAYMGFRDNFYPKMLARAERATTALTETELTAAAGTPEEAEQWIQLANNFKYIIITTTFFAGATVRRQHQTAMGLEVHRQLCQRFSTPCGKCSIGFLTTLLKPIFKHNSFEESFSTWD